MTLVARPSRAEDDVVEGEPIRDRLHPVAVVGGAGPMIERVSPDDLI